MIKTENTIIPKYMTIKDIVAYSGIPANWVRTWIKNGEVESFRPGNKTIFVDVESFMTRCSGKKRGVADGKP